MKTLASRWVILAVVVAAVALYSHRRHAIEVPARPAAAGDLGRAEDPETAGRTPAAVETPDASPEPSDSKRSPFHCDGRTYCSQMTSCAEAKYFLEHCPDTKMDGDHDGIPCERQWCPNG